MAIENEYIKITGGKAQFVREVIEKEVPSEQFLAHIEDTMSVNTGILPRNCFYMLKEDDRIVYAIEIQASIKKVVWLDRHNGERSNHMISIPYTQFYIQARENGMVGNMFISCTKTPVLSLTDELFVPPYPNIYERGEGSVCTGSMRVPQDAPLGAKINNIVSGFFEADFNKDLTPSWLFGVDDYNEYLPRWEEATKADRFFAVADTTEYRPRGTTVGAFIKSKISFG